MPPRRLDPRAIDDLTDSVEERISEKVKSDFKSEFEDVRAEFRSQIASMKSDMIAEIVSALGGVPRHVGTEDGYEEVAEDFEFAESSGEARTERPSGIRVGQSARPGSQLKLKHKMEVSNFSGTLNPEDLIDWIGELEDYFELEDIEDPLRVRLAQTKLKGHAALWWKELQRDREEEGEMKITRWRLMVAKLKAKFIPADYELELFKKLQNLKQKDMTVKDYTEEFYRLTIRSGHRELSKEKVARYINGLRFNIQDEVGMLNISSVEDAYQYALRAEEKLKRKNQGSSRGKEKQDSLAQDKPKVEGEPRPFDQKRRAGGGVFRGNCFRCGQEGHRSFECPIARTTAIVNEDAVPEIQPEQGESLLAQRVLIGERTLDFGQRTSLFRTHCKSGGKVCKVIVDGGSTDNLVAEEMVQKLGLKRVRHPYPYRIGWLQGKHALEVREQCLVDFQIGQYKDQVLCDIVDMNSCHVLLGRPWQYDCRAVHDCVRNVFTVEKGGRKFSLIPLQNEELGRRNLSIGSRVEWIDSERVGDQHGKKTYGTPTVDVKKKKKNKGKNVQVEDLEDMYVKNEFGIYVLNSRRCSSSY